MKKIASFYNLFLALGAFYIGFSMVSGVYETFPKEWAGKIPFTNWLSLALFGGIVFGIGNAVAFIYGLIKKDPKIFLITFAMGVLFLLTTLISTNLVGEWYLITGQFLILSIVQLSIALTGIILEKVKRKKTTSSL